MSCPGPDEVASFLQLTLCTSLYLSGHLSGLLLGPQPP